MVLLYGDSICLMFSMKARIPWSHFPVGHHRCHWAGFQILLTILKKLLWHHGFLTVLKLVVVVVVDDDVVVDCFDRVSWHCWPHSSLATVACSQVQLSQLVATIHNCSQVQLPQANPLSQGNWPATLEQCTGWAAVINVWFCLLNFYFERLIGNIGRWRTAPLMSQSTPSPASSRWQLWRWQWDDNDDKEWWKQRSQKSQRW